MLPFVPLALVITLAIGIKIGKFLHPRTGVQVFSRDLIEDPQFIADLTEAIVNSYARKGR